MGVQCPKCNANIEQDFGLANCPQCSTILSIDVDGNVQVIEAPVADTPPTAETALEAATESPTESPVTEPDEPEPSPEPEFVSVLDTFSDEQPEITEAAPSISTAQEIANFGNSESSASPLTYVLIIDGIDLAEVKSQVIEALTDSKFNWEKVDILQKIKSGKLTLEALSPAQAVMVVRRLQGLSVQLSWRQHVYS